MRSAVDRKEQAIPEHRSSRSDSGNPTGGRVLRFFPALNIPEEDLWGSLESLLGLVAAG